MPLDVAVIGVGASGLSALHHLASDPEHFSPVAFDKAAQVGGLWVYSDDTNLDQHGLPVHSAMYTNLRVNVSKEMMGFIEFPFTADYPTWPRHDQIHQYLQHYTEHFDLLKYIKFQTIVTKVHPMKTQDHVIWHVTTRNLVTNDIETATFDAVFVCNGRESIPSIPDIPGKDTFRGVSLHSKSYRTDEPFHNKIVVIVGMSFSGADLAFELAQTAKQIYCTHSRVDAFAKSIIPNNVHMRPRIREITQDGVILKNGEYLPCDVIIFCTGYHYSFPFLQEDCHVSTDDDRITPLYKHIFHIDHPSLCFIGLPRRIFHFQAYSAQAAYACAVLRHEVTLPSETEMREDEDEDFQRRIVKTGQHPKMTHNLLGEPMVEYFDFLSDKLATPCLSRVPIARQFIELHIKLWSTRFHDFRSIDFKVLDDDILFVQ